MNKFVINLIYLIYIQNIRNIVFVILLYKKKDQFLIFCTNYIYWRWMCFGNFVFAQIGCNEYA